MFFLFLISLMYSSYFAMLGEEASAPAGVVVDGAAEQLALLGSFVGLCSSQLVLSMFKLFYLPEFTVFK